MPLTRVAAGAAISVALVVFLGGTGNSFELLRLTEEKPWIERQNDQLPADAVARLGTVRFKNQLHGVRCLAFSPDGKQLANNRFMWDVATGKVLRLLPEYCQAISPDWKTTIHFATFSGVESKTTLRDMQSGKTIRELEWPNEKMDSRNVEFAPNGKSVLYVRSLHSDNDQARARVMDLTSGKTLADFNAERIDAYTFSQDSQTVAFAITKEGVHTLQLWDIAKSAVVRSIELGDLAFQLAYSPDGKLLAVGCWGHIQVFEVATGKELGRMEANLHLGLGCGAVNCAFSPDSKTLVADLGEGTIYLWDVATAKTRLTLGGGMYTVDCLAFSPDGITLAACIDIAVRCWDIQTGKELFPEFEGHEYEVESMAFSPDGKVLATNGGMWCLIRLWDFAGLKFQRRLDSFSGGFAFSPDGKRLASCANNNVVHISELATGKDIQTIRVPEVDRVYHVQYSPDGRLSTLGCTYDQTNAEVHYRLCHLDKITGKLQRSWLLPPEQLSWTIAPDGETAFFPSKEIAAVQNIRTGRSRWLEGQEQVLGEWMQQASFSPDGRIVASRRPSDWSLWLWETSTGKKIDVLKTHEKPNDNGAIRLDRLRAAAWSPDCRLLAYLDGVEQNSPDCIRLLDMATRKDLKCITGFRDYVHCLAFSPDGRSLVAGFTDEILVWKLDDLLPKLGIEERSQAQLETYWTDLLGEDADQAQRSSWALIAAPRQAIAMLRDRLKPLAAADAGKVRKLIGQLDDDRYAVREAATQELTELGGQAAAQVAKTLQDELSEESKRRLKLIAKRVRDADHPPQMRRTLRAVMVLEMIGTPEARQVLQSLAQGAPEVPVTQDATAALKRLSCRQLADGRGLVPGSEQ